MERKLVPNLPRSIFWRIFTPPKKLTWQQENKHLKMYPLHSPINNGDFPACHLHFSGAKNAFFRAPIFWLAKVNGIADSRWMPVLLGGTHTAASTVPHKTNRWKMGGQNGWWKLLSYKTSKDFLGKSIRIFRFFFTEIGIISPQNMTWDPDHPLSVLLDVSSSYVSDSMNNYSVCCM